jgi:Family of unknown function (DUF6600)/FecR protein
MKSYPGSLATVLLAGALALGVGAAADAQQAPPDSQQPAQNDQGAGRISFIHGDLSTQHSGSNDWAAATLNTPVVNGDHLSTGPDSRAEIQLDHANILRMSGQSTANVVNLSQNQIQVQVGQGLVNYDILKNNEIGAEIDTPNVAIRPQMGEGSYRIQVNSDGETIVDVRKGSAEISTPQGSTIVQRDQRITIEGNAESAQYQVSGAPGRDDWDKWNGDRDHTIESADSWRHTNPYYTGTQDLDAYGHWDEVPDYGAVWFPAAGSGWAPYRDGRWVYEPYYGWTWVSYEPWGWAPYHYGRWFVYGGNWGWWPGPIYGGYRPIWAPAYVSFFGFGGGDWGLSVGFGFGGGFGRVGWLPCGPGDRFYPWYGRGVDRVNVVNVYNNHDHRGGFDPLRNGPHAYSNIDRASSDARVRNGFSSMQRDEFGRGRVSMQQSRIDPGSFRKASLMTGANPVSPSRESFRPTDRAVNSRAIPSRSFSNQHFFSSNARPNSSFQGGRGTGNFSRGGSPAGGQARQNSVRPGFRSFGPSNSGNTNSGNRAGGFGGRANATQQNFGRQGSEASRPGFRSFGPGNSGNGSRSPASEQTSRPSQTFNPGQRGFTPPSTQHAPANQSSRPGWRTFTPPSGETRSYGGGRTYQGQGQGGAQPRSNYSQPSEAPRQYQNNSRGRSYNSGYSRPTLDMRQPVVTPRGEGSYSRSSGRGGNNGGGYRGAPSGGGSRGGYSGGGPRGGSSSDGGHSSSGRNRR